MINQGDKITVTGRFLSNTNIARKLVQLSEIEMQIRKINNPSDYLSSRMQVLVEDLRKTAYTMIIGIPAFFMLERDIPDENTRLVIMAFVFLICLAVSVIDVFMSPKSHTDALAKMLSEYKPLTSNQHEVILLKMKVSLIVDITEIMSWIQLERKELNGRKESTT